MAPLCNAMLSCHADTLSCCAGSPPHVENVQHGTSPTLDGKQQQASVSQPTDTFKPEAWRPGGKNG